MCRQVQISWLSSQFSPVFLSELCGITRFINFGQNLSFDSSLMTQYSVEQSNLITIIRFFRRTYITLPNGLLTGRWILTHPNATYFALRTSESLSNLHTLLILKSLQRFLNVTTLVLGALNLFAGVRTALKLLLRPTRPWA